MRSCFVACHRAFAVLVLVACVFSAAGCDDNPMSPPYHPELPTEWAGAVTNAFFPLVPGTRAVFEADTDEGHERIVVEVLSAPRVVNGVTATAVSDSVYLDGGLIEATFDWFAQDIEGNVWYLGEDSKEIEDGQVVSTEGSWEWGVDGALPGIIMWSNPGAHIGEEYRQEYYEDEAEDWGKVIAVDQSATVPYGDFTGCVQIEEWNGLESGAHENKYYASGIGVVLEVGGERVELVELTQP